MTTQQKKKEKRETLMSPVGTAMFPYLNKPAPPYGNAKDKPPQWKVTLKLRKSEPEVQAFLADLQARYDKNLAEAELEETPKAKAERLKSKNPELGADLPFKDEIDEQGQETGYALVNLKQGAYAVSQKTGERWDFFVDLFDAKGTRIDRDKVRIGGGSKIIAAFEVSTFFTEIGAGLSLRLKAVQVLERVEGQGKDAAGYGFRQQDGFSAEEADARGEDATEDDGSTGGADDGSI
jgi:hypothetical protein